MKNNENDEVGSTFSIEFPMKDFKTIISSTFSEFLEKDLKPLLLNQRTEPPLLTKKQICEKLQIRPSTFEHHKEALMTFGMFQPNGQGSSFRMRPRDLDKYIDYLISKDSIDI